MTDVRPVWISREQRDWIAHYSAMAGVYDVFGELTDAWDSAPKDPEAALGVAIGHALLMPPKFCEHVTKAALVALRVALDDVDAELS